MNTKRRTTEGDLQSRATMKRTQLYAHFKQMPAKEVRVFLAERGKVGKTKKDFLAHIMNLSDEALMEENGLETPREKLKSMLMTRSDREALEVFQELATIKAEREGKGLEDVVYPQEFLGMILDTMTKTLTEQLEQHGAPKEAIDLLEDLTMFNVWMAEVHKGGGLVQGKINQFLMETVANASRNIASVGGTFYSPFGELKSREIVKE